MEKLVNNIIEKVRFIFCYDKKFISLLNKDAEVKLKENEGELILVNISFISYDELIIYLKQIIYFPEIGNKDVLLEYEDWKQLLEM